MKEKLTYLQAQGDFHFQFYIEKAIPSVDDTGMLIVEGVASTVNIDHDNERMAGDALESMARQINTSGVPLRIEHDKDDRAIVGEVFKAWVDERNQLWIRAAIDPKHSAGPLLHESLRQGAKFGLSVGGRVKNAIRELSEATGKMVKTFYDVSLDEVSVTKRPANYDAWLFAKSYKEKDQDVEPFYKSPLFREFLSQNLQLDYAYQFAKSIPDKAWKKVDTNLIIDKNMNDKEEKKDKSEEKDEEKKDKSEEKDEEKEKSFVSKADFSKFSSEVTKGFANIGRMLKAMSTDAKDTTNPDKDKEENVGDTAKSEDSKDEEKKDKSEDAVDQTNPDKKKEENVGDTAKSEEKDEEKDKSADDDKDEKKDKSDKNDEKEKSEDDKKDDEKEKAEKEPKNLEEAVKSIENMTKRMFGTKEVAKSEVRKSEGQSSIDSFAAAITTALMGMEERFEKSGTNVPGLARMISDMIKGDPEVQKSIAAMMKEPGFKKSVSMHVPYMVGKDGRKFALTATPAEDSEVKKSMAGKSFSEVYKKEFSAFGEGDRA